LLGAGGGEEEARWVGQGGGEGRAAAREPELSRLRRELGSTSTGRIGAWG
jgi:hypothetical protein